MGGRTTRMPVASIITLFVLICFLAILLESTRYGLDMTDQSFVLYGLANPQADVAFSGFGWLFSPLGALFDHSTIAYRIMAIVLNVLAMAYLVSTVSTYVSRRFGMQLPRVLALSLGIALAAIERAMLTDLHYNTVMNSGVVLLAGATLRASVQRPGEEFKGWHFLAVICGTVLALHARSVSGLAICLGIGVIAVPVLRLVGLVPSFRSQSFLLLGLPVGLLLAVLSGLWLGNLEGLFETQSAIAAASGGIDTYLTVYQSGLLTLLTIAKQQSLTLAAMAVALAAAFAVLRFGQVGTLSRITRLPASIFTIQNAFSALMVGWTVVLILYLPWSRHQATGVMWLTGLIAGFAFALVLADKKRFSDRPSQLAFFVLVGTLLLLPFLSTLGSSVSLLNAVAFHLGPLGVLIALPISQPRGSDINQFGHWFIIPGLAMVCMCVLFARENAAYRTPGPIHQTQTVMLTSPPMHRGLLVDNETATHLRQLNAMLDDSDINRDTDRLVALYRSPGSVLGANMRTVGSVWTFDHVPDEDFNCPLIRRGLAASQPRLLVLATTDISAAMRICFADAGYGDTADWKRLGCIVQSPSFRGSPSAADEACLFDAGQPAGRN